ncbi:MAG TPA: hypothetical protein VF139_19725 [Candidatus Polarisedimenticolaceae bacterium]
MLLRHALDATEVGRWIELSSAAERWLVEVEYLWPGNVRQVEQLAAKLKISEPALYKKLKEHGPGGKS